MRTVNGEIAEAAERLKANGDPVTATYLMWEVLNTTTDEELYELGSDIVDVAEKVEYFLTGVGR